MGRQCTFTDVKSTVNFFDEDRVNLLAKSLAPNLVMLWTKAKEEDITSMTSDAMWRLLTLTTSHDVLNPDGRVKVCDIVAAACNLEYTQRAKVRKLKPGKKPKAKQLEATSSLFMQYISLLAFVLFGDVRKKFQLAEASA